MISAVLINGVPASGKSTVCALLTRYLSERGMAPVPFALDTFKEAMFDQIGTGDREYNRKLGRASYQGIFASIAAFPDKAIPLIDAWHGFQPLSVLEKHLAMAGIGYVIEVWCAVTPQTASQRYRDRVALRSSGHPPASYADELAILAAGAKPLGIGPVISLDTEQPVAVSDLKPVADLLAKAA